eukprot:Nk52_evm26s2356 gene=Nk52_evmTU26s2356
MSKRAIPAARMPKGCASPRKSPAAAAALARRKKPLEINGLCEAEIRKIQLADHLCENLDVVFVGINPGLFSAAFGHHYAGPNNHFWPCLHESGLVSKKRTFLEDGLLKDTDRIGFTNMVHRTTRGSDELSKKEIQEGVQSLVEKICKYRPHVVCFNGKGIYTVFAQVQFGLTASRAAACSYGKQDEFGLLGKSELFVMPSTSARTASFPKAEDKLPFFTELKKIIEIRRNTERGTNEK